MKCVNICIHAPSISHTFILCRFPDADRVGTVLGALPFVVELSFFSLGFFTQGCLPSGYNHRAGFFSSSSSSLAVDDDDEEMSFFSLFLPSPSPSRYRYHRHSCWRVCRHIYDVAADKFLSFSRWLSKAKKKGEERNVWIIDFLIYRKAVIKWCWYS